MTPEGKVKEAVKKLLREHGAYWHMPVQNGMGAPALDFHVCHNGRYAGIETKAKGKHATVRQNATMMSVMRAGGSVFLIDDSEGADMAALVSWLTMQSNSRIVSPAVYQSFGASKDESRDDRFGDPEHSERQQSAEPGSSDLQ